MKKFLSNLILIALASVPALAQQFPIYTQYTSNPYVINPGFIAHTGRPEINLSYRQQWTGFEDGPKTIQGDVQFPINKKISLGLNVINDRTVLLSQFNGYLTFGYRIPLTSKQQLSFGLSAGVVSNQLDLDEVPGVDLNDPVVKNAVNNIDFDGQFGVGYSFGKFSLGFSLLKLVKGTPFYNGESFEDYEFDVFKDKAAFISYRFDITPRLSFQPYALYRSTFTGFEYYEGTGLFNISNVVTIGGGYRTDFGPIAVLRFRISKARMGYSYDFPSTKYRSSTQGTNEVQLKWLFGDEPPLAAKETKTAPPEKTEPMLTEQKNEQEVEAVAQVEPEKPKQEVTEVKQPEVQQEQVAVTPAQEQEEQTISEPVKEEAPVTKPASPTVAKWYLIVGTFEKKSNAERLAKSYQQQGVHATIKLHNNYYYVHIPEFATNEITVEKVMEIRNSTPHKDAWFKQLDD